MTKTATAPEATTNKPKLIGLDKLKKALCAALEKCRPALLIGEAGTGKTTAAQELATELGRKVYRVNLNGYITPDMLIGRYQARAKQGTETFFQYGLLPKAMKEGAVLILDEINAALPDTLFCLHAVLEEKPRLFIPETDEEVTPADGFSVIATMNPSHDYAGTRGLNAALYSRFSIVLRFPTLGGADLLQALKEHAPSADDKSIADIAKIIESATLAKKEERITTRITLREAINALEYIKWLSKKDAIEAAIFSKLEPHERAEVNAKELDTLAHSIDTVIARSNNYGELEKKIAKLEKEIATMSELKRTLEVFAAKQVEEVKP